MSGPVSERSGGFSVGMPQRQGVGGLRRAATGQQPRRQGDDLQRDEHRDEQHQRRNRLWQ